MAEAGRRPVVSALTAVAVVSALAGAVLAVWPAVVLAIVTLFYDSAGGVLILLGNLISVLPHPAAPGATGGTLPEFQLLQTDALMVLARSLAATVFSSAAAVILLAPHRRRDRRGWVAAALCSAAGALAGGAVVAVALLPALVISGGVAALPRR